MTENINKNDNATSADMASTDSTVKTQKTRRFNRPKAKANTSVNEVTTANTEVATPAVAPNTSTEVAPTETKKKTGGNSRPQRKPRSKAVADAADANSIKTTSTPAVTTVRNSKDTHSKLSIIPLGGLGEIGKNMTAIRYGNNIIVIDAGMSFPDEELLGIDLVIPDISYLIEQKQYVRGIFITHGHEDHIGALPYVLRELDVPVYAGKLPCGLIKNKLKDHRLGNINLNEVVPGDMINCGPFKLEYIRVSHSIPDSFAIAIHTPIGTILHTGDFKVDLSPVDDQPIDLPRFAALGSEGVLALLADSTNVEKSGYTPMEKTVGEKLEGIFATAKGRIVLTTFASNIHRVQQSIWAAEKFNRKVAFVGRGMVNVSTIARELGYLKSKAGTIVELEETKKMPDNKVVILTTGSQGETLSGLSLMSQDEHRQVHLRPTDRVVISANTIPGNEKMVGKMVDNLYRHGVEVVYGSGLGIHVSGHASSEELKLILSLVRPKYFIPAHGEHRMLHRHANLAQSLGVSEKNTFIMENGQVLELNKRSGKITGKVPSGRVLIDGRGVGDIGTSVLKDRKLLSSDGIVVVVMSVDRATNTLVGKPEITTRGFVFEKENEDILEQSRQKVVQTWERFAADEYNASAIKGSIRGTLSKYLYDKTGRRPILVTMIVEA